jgi:raffinose/stachyose/melibiose transport system permease protein
VVPALLVYAIFFIYPFFRGLAVSFTNWDGLTPKTPITMEKKEFEDRILSKVAREGDKDFLLSIYSLDAAGENYARLSLGGMKRARVERILHRAGYEAASNKWVGFSNYIEIFTGKVDERFYPRRYVKTNYNENSGLPDKINGEDYEKNFLSKLKTEDAALAGRFYRQDGEAYALSQDMDEFAMEDRVWLLGEVDGGAVESSAVDELLAAVKKAGLGADPAAKDAALSSFLGAAKLSAHSVAEVKAAADELYGIGAFKRLLARTWIESKLDLGVTGFTLFFAFFTVIGSNVLAFLLALALDTKMKTRNVLRSVFFMPNVLSMIVVALIWSIVFFRLLPPLTGIEKWMGDSDKAPWLLVMVAVWQGAGYYMIVYLAGLQNIPTDILEAATIDGTTWPQQLRHITLPLLIPAITVSIFLSTANALKCFDLVYAMVGPSGYALGTVPYVMDIFFDAFAKKLAGLATAKATLLFLTILAVTGIQLVIMKRKEVQL